MTHIAPISKNQHLYILDNIIEAMSYRCGKTHDAPMWEKLSQPHDKSG